MTMPTPHLRELPPRSIVRIDVHGPKDRAKDGVPCSLATISRARDGCMHFVVHADGVPLLGDLRTSAVIGAFVCSGGTTTPETDRPRSSFGRRPAKSDAFQKTRMPSTATTREGMFSRRDCSLRPSRRLSRSRRPHFDLSRGQCCLIGHCEVTMRSPAVRDSSRVQTPLGLVGTRLGLTT
jgi:hypothetical protein